MSCNMERLIFDQSVSFGNDTEIASWNTSTNLVSKFTSVRDGWKTLHGVISVNQCGFGVPVGI